MTDKAFSALPATTSGALDYSADYLHVFDTSDYKLPLGDLFAGVWGDSLRVTADGAAAGGAVVSGYGLTMYGTQLVRGSTSTTAGTIEHQSSTGTKAARVVVDPTAGEYRIDLDPDGTIGTGQVSVRVGGTDVARVAVDGTVRVGNVGNVRPHLSGGAAGVHVLADGFLSLRNDGGTFWGGVTATAGGSCRFFYGATSTVVGSIAISDTGTAYNTTSDYRLKHDNGLIAGALDRVAALPARRFGWVNTPEAPVVDGFFAHEAAAVVPEAVTGEKDAVEIDPETGHEVPVYQQIDQAKLVPVLWAAVQELAGQVTALEARIAALEAGAP